MRGGRGARACREGRSAQRLGAGRRRVHGHVGGSHGARHRPGPRSAGARARGARGRRGLRSGGHHRRARRAPGRGAGARGRLRPRDGPRASARFAGRDDLAVDDAEHLSLAPKSAEVVTCSFGLMYCYDAAAALRSAARTLRPGGRMLQVVWGHASNVWWVPVIELIESRARHFSAVCPMMFFYGPPGVMPRMVDGAGLDPIEQVTLETTMAFAGFDDALDTAIHRGPLAGPYRHRLDADAQAEVLEAMRSHVEGMAVRDADGIRLPAEASLTVAARPARIS